VSAQDIMIVAQAAILVLGGLGLTAAQRGKRAAVRAKDHRELQRRYLAALRHIFRLEEDRASRGLPRIARPKELEERWHQDGGDDGGPEPARA
jgi:hypothetical protein